MSYQVPEGTTVNGKDTKPYTYSDYQNGTYTIVSKVAYLIGVQKKIFENEHEPPKMEIYQKLNQDKNARIVRNLCMLRTAIERNYGEISKAFYYDLKNLTTLPDLVPQPCIMELEQDGVSIYRANYKLNQYIIDINTHIANRINNCKDIFPIWLKWDYIRQLFIMPNGNKEAGIKKAGTEYYLNKAALPYQVYMNWTGSKDGNILYHDRKFVSLLYEANEDYFTDMSKVTDAGNVAKDGIYSFLEGSERTVLVVDCENSDPYKLYATLNNLKQEALLSKIVKILLYNDVHTTTAWKILNQFTQIPIEHKMLERLKENKSYLDVTLSVGTCREFFQNRVDSFILASSDSDYWGMISSLPEARFLVMIEEQKSSYTIIDALEAAGITYCYIDDFCTGNSNQIKVQAVLREVTSQLEQEIHFNINDILNEAYTATRADMSTAEKNQFYSRYIKPMRLVVDSAGNVTVKLGPL